MRNPRSYRMALMLTDDEVAEVQDFRFAHRIGSQAGAMRRLIKHGLDAAKEKGPAATAIAPDHGSNDPR